MRKFRMALLAAGLGMAFTGAHAGEQAGGSAQSDERGTQAQGTNAAVPPGADADARTTQAGEPGPGVRHGSNEGGSDRETTAEQPTATPGTAENIDEQSPRDKPARQEEMPQRQ